MKNGEHDQPEEDLPETIDGRRRAFLKTVLAGAMLGIPLTQSLAFGEGDDDPPAGGKDRGKGTGRQGKGDGPPRRGERGKGKGIDPQGKGKGKGDGPRRRGERGKGKGIDPQGKGDAGKGKGDSGSGTTGKGSGKDSGQSRQGPTGDA